MNTVLHVFDVVYCILAKDANTCQKVSLCAVLFWSLDAAIQLLSTSPRILQRQRSHFLIGQTGMMWCWYLTEVAVSRFLFRGETSNLQLMFHQCVTSVMLVEISNIRGHDMFPSQTYDTIFWYSAVICMKGTPQFLYRILRSSDCVVITSYPYCTIDETLTC